MRLSEAKIVKERCRKPSDTRCSREDPKLRVFWEFVESNESAESIAIAFEMLLGPGPHKLDGTRTRDKVNGI